MLPSRRRYEDIVENPVNVMRLSYDACGLAWSAGIERFIRETSLDSNVGDAWRENLGRNQPDLAERFSEIASGSYGRLCDRTARSEPPGRDAGLRIAATAERAAYVCVIRVTSARAGRADILC